MKKNLFLLLLGLNSLIYAQDTLEFTDLYGDYLEQIPPGDTPKRFEPGIITGFKHSPIAISPHGDEIFWVETEMISAQDARERIKFTRYENGTWTNPAYAGFVRGYLSYHHSGTVFSPDGDRLYFISNRPGGLGNFDLWYVEKNETGWGDAVNAGEPYNTTDREISPVFTNTGKAYRLGYTNSPTSFTYSNGIFSDPVSIDNQPVTDWYSSVYISPEEEYLIFTGDDPPNLYIRFKDNEKHWTDPINMGYKINTSQPERFPVVSPDGKYLFFLRGEPSNLNNYFWVSTAIIDKIKRTTLPDPNGLIRNISTGQRFSSIQCAIDYANPNETIEIEPGIYEESFTLDKDIILQSVDPNDSYYVGGTIIQADPNLPVVTLSNNSSACEIAGLAIRAGSIGIIGNATNAIIHNCRIMDNRTHGLELSEASCPTLRHCLVTANGQTGITMLQSPGRNSISCTPRIEDCVIVQNGNVSIDGGEPNIIDSLIQD